MAQSPAHKLGQIIGDTVEGAIEPLLREFADEHGLYLDTHGDRPARRGRKLRWEDEYGNTHDLDFVLERDGTDEVRGEPAAFIESAYRRYTKHSRNKAQEIQGAVLPLKRTFWEAHPFTGVVLAGEFTDGAINQLQSLGFSVLYFGWDSLVRAFRSEGVNIHFGEGTPEDQLAEKVAKWQALDATGHRRIAEELLIINEGAVDEFMRELETIVTRAIEAVLVIPLHGEPVEQGSIEEALQFVTKYGGDGDHQPLRRFEIQIRYTNGDRIEAQFQERTTAIEFLQQYQ